MTDSAIPDLSSMGLDNKTHLSVKVEEEVAAIDEVQNKIQLCICL